MQKEYSFTFWVSVDNGNSFFPYRFTKLNLSTDRFQSKSSFIFTPVFISKYIRYEKFKGEIYKGELSFEDFANKKFTGYKVRLDFFLTERALILLAGGFVHILFCVVLRKDRGRKLLRGRC